ncbi:MAG: 3-deoxy-8-phosphooctulonate synthase [Alphaproteobacteria bacterium CG_4_10_14_0_8_um_filter_53_9]|nr:MAG: 3-deoxy-8-phosphooctulonate synthase [Alphaproteobacteria bacterium CG_4_10_14_0_8_um_filter_53_9]
MDFMTVQAGKAGVTPVSFSNALPLAVIAGTCALESREITMRTAEEVVRVAKTLGFGVVYKGSFDKANRTSATGARGMGMEAGLRFLQEVRETFGVPVLTDVHEISQVDAVADAVDVIQIPAFLSRQTNLLLACGAAAAARRGLVVNIKKGQFMAPADMIPAAAKIASAGTEAILLTERGATFGYNNLVVDMRSYATMAASGYPVIHDASHCVMMPSVRGDASGGDRSFIPPLARAAVGAGIAGIFIETHPDPASAISDKETQWPLGDFERLMADLMALDAVVKPMLVKAA